MRWLDGVTDSMDMSLSKLQVGDGQGGLECCSSWGRKESDTTERLNGLKMFFLLIKLEINTQVKVNLCLPFWLALKNITHEDLCECFQYFMVISHHLGVVMITFQRSAM